MKMDSMITEVTVGFKGGGIIHVHDTSDHMHSSINLVAHKLQKAVNRRHEKLRDTAIRAERRSKMEEHEQMQNCYGEDLEWARKYKSTSDVSIVTFCEHHHSSYFLSFHQWTDHEHHHSSYFLSFHQWTGQDLDLPGEGGDEDGVDTGLQDAEKDMGDPLVEREKRFDMAPMTVQEATAALGMIDHPFYLFRNKVKHTFSHPPITITFILD